jgi:hypothetical protein
VTIHLSVCKFLTTGMAGKPVYDLLAWSTRGLPSVGPMQRHLGNQDAFFC